MYTKIYATYHIGCIFTFLTAGKIILMNHAFYCIKYIQNSILLNVKVFGILEKWYLHKTEQARLLS